MKNRITWLNEETACKIIAAILIWVIFAMALVHIAVEWQGRELKQIEKMNKEIEDEVGKLTTRVVERQELWAHALIISPIDSKEETDAADVNTEEIYEVLTPIEDLEVVEAAELEEVADEMLIEEDNSIEEKNPEITEKTETVKVIEETPEIQEVKAEEPIVAASTIQFAEVPKVTVSTSEEFPYTIEDFLQWNGIDKEYLIVTIAKVIYVEARGVERSGKVSVGATICHWGRSGRITNLWDILSGYAPINSIDYYALIWDPIEGETMKLCREAAEAAIAGEDPAGDMMGASTYYFLDPSKSDPDNVRVMTAAYHQVWIENQLFCGYDGVDWMQK